MPEIEMGFLMIKAFHFVFAFTATATALGIATTPAHAGFFDEVGKVLGDVGTAVGKGVTDGANAVAKGVQDGGNAIGKGVNDGANAVAKGVNDGADAVAKGVSDGGNAVGKWINDGVNAVVKATDDTGHALEKATQDTGQALEKATHDTGHAFEGAGQFVGKHPWETVIGVALIAGGGYLILYEGYALTISVEGVQVVSVTAGSTAAGATSGIVITAGATSGIAAGSATALGGAGVIALGYYKDGPHSEVAEHGNQIYGNNAPSGNSDATSASSLSKDVPFGPLNLSATMIAKDHEAFHRSLVFQQRDRGRVVIASPRAPSSATSAVTSDAGRAVEPVVISESNSSIMFEPWLPKNPTDLQRYAYASWVNKWAQKTLPPEKFDPETPYAISKVELKILDAIANLEAIKASEDDMAEEQRESRLNPVPDLVAEQVKESGKDIALSILMRKDPRDVFTVAKQLEIFGAEAPGIRKGLLIWGAPEAAGVLGELGLIEIGTVFGPLLSSTATSEGMKEGSEELAGQLRRKLNAYTERREQKFGSPSSAKRDIPVQTVINEPQGLDMNMK
jgi:ElaB/YqjD/DUF883 family membrane-anchored ribosome-binding protein